MKYVAGELCRLFILLLLSIHSPAAADTEQDMWIEPDAWGREHFTLSMSNNNEQCCKCAEDAYLPNGAEGPLAYTEDGVALMYYRKLISQLLNRKHLEHDAEEETYRRFLSFSITSSQLLKLEQLKDPRDMDDILADVFQSAHNKRPYMYKNSHCSGAGFKDSMSDVLFTLSGLFESVSVSEIRFLLAVVLVVLFIWFVHRRYHISWLVLVAGGLFCFGYLHTYIECNRELEVNEMMKMLDRTKQSEEQEQQSGVLSYIKRLFVKENSLAAEREMLVQSTKISLGFCRPDHVLIVYINDIFLKYLETLLEKCTHSLSVLQGGLPFPYNYLSNVLLLCIIGYLLKLTFKYILSPAAWSQLFRQPHWHAAPNGALPDANSHSHDRISGENLKILLTAIGATAAHSAKSPEAVSGVEEVREAIQAKPSGNVSVSSTSSSEKTPPKNSSNNNTVAGETDVKIEDLPDEV